MSKDGTAIFARGCRFDGSACFVCHQLGAIADAEHRIVAAQTVELGFEGFLVIDREWAARQDDAFDALIAVGKLVVGNDLAVSAEFAHAATDQLGSL